MNQNIGIAIHGGAGTISRELMTSEKEAQYQNGLRASLLAGYTLLEKGESSLDAVEASVKVLENNVLFNAGKGAVFNHNGTHEMDASIMTGESLQAGAVAGVKGIKNPISLARQIMEKSEHVFLCGSGAEEFARLQNMVFEKDEYFFSQQRFDQLQSAINENKILLDHGSKEEKKFGTVGAVAIDIHGNLAAATSTGGMTNKMFGRIGDTPLIGAGTYANNNSCAVSCTGHGEYFIRAMVAHDVACLMEYKSWSLEKACNFVVMEKLKNMGGEGGLIAIDHQGNVCFSFNSEGMYRGKQTNGGHPEVYIF